VTQYAPNPPQQTPEKPSNGLGTSGFVLGLIGLIFSFIPVIGMVAWPLVILGIIFSAIGFNKANKGRATNKGLAITGLVVSIIGLVICIVWAVAFGNAVDDVVDEANREVTIVYEITGDAANVSVTYVTYSDEKSDEQQETAATLPWSKEVKAKGLVKEGQVIATTGAEGGTVTCKITVDGKEVSTKTATGQFAIADCASI
jgi:heme/copper-type cytochrome/quinol oxidase subunit 2